MCYVVSFFEVWIYGFWNHESVQEFAMYMPLFKGILG